MPSSPAALPFRDRPVLEHIVEQHAEEAAFLWTLRDAATDAPHYKRHHLARLDERVEAHVDGLRVAGEAGWRIALEQLERRCEKGELFAAGVLALESGDMRRVEPLVARGEAEPEARRGFVAAIAWCRPAVLRPTVRTWDASTAGFEQYLALCTCSVHRVDLGPGLAERLAHPEPMVRARALRLAGELGRVEHLGSCLRFLEDADADTAFQAAWSSVLLGDRAAGLEAMQAWAAAESPHRRSALEVCVRAMGLEHGSRFVRALNGDPGSRRWAVVALGHLGDAAAIPWLIARMEQPDLARVAGESLAMIAGLDIAEEDLERSAAPDKPAEAPGDQASDEVPAEDPNAYLPWPDPALVRAWWERAGRHRLPAGQRHLLGLPNGPDAWDRAYRDGFQRQRCAAAYEAKLACAGSALRAVAAR